MYNRASSEDLRRSPKSCRNSSHEYCDREYLDKERDRDHIQDSGREQDRDRELEGD